MKTKESDDLKKIAEYFYGNLYSKVYPRTTVQLKEAKIIMGRRHALGDDIKIILITNMKNFGWVEQINRDLLKLNKKIIV